MNDPERCARCRRAVALRGRTPDGRICSACCARRQSGTCDRCDREGRLVGRHPDGQRWCERCRQGHRREVIDAEWRGRVLAAVAEVEPGLRAEVVTEVVDRAASSRKALRWLGAHLDNHPRVLIEGPTSTVPVLDRFTRELAAAGARWVGVIHPACEGCGRRERPHGRRDQGWVCPACWARANLQPCHGCGNIRRVSARRDGEAWCPSCVRRQQGEAERDRLSDLIAATVVRADVGVDAGIVLRAVERVAPRLFRRRELAAMVDAATLQVSAHQPALLARLVADLRSQGAVGLAAPLCEDREAVAVETIVTGSHVRCGPCARRPAERSAPSCRPARAERRRSRADRNESNRGTCGDCGGGRRLLDVNLRCRACRERAARFCDRCCGGAPLTRVGDERLCWTCALQVRVDALLPDVDDGPCGLLRHAL